MLRSVNDVLIRCRRRGQGHLRVPVDWRKLGLQAVKDVIGLMFEIILRTWVRLQDKRTICVDGWPAKADHFLSLEIGSDKAELKVPLLDNPCRGLITPK
jgi:hypothetical protein